MGILCHSVYTSHLTKEIENFLIYLWGDNYPWIFHVFAYPASEALIALCLGLYVGVCKDHY